MKKVLAMIITCMLLAGYASAEEIQFINIPWLSDDTQTIQMLIDGGYIIRNSSYALKNENQIYLVEDNDLELIRPDIIIGANDVSYIIDLKGCVKGKIGGSPVKEIIPTFAYDGEYKLISVEVKLIGAKYNDLKDKLTKKYGEGKVTLTEEGICVISWVSDNSSAVVLYTQNDGYDYTLMYGRLDAAEILSNCLAAPDPDDVSGL